MGQRKNNDISKIMNPAIVEMVRQHTVSISSGMKESARVDGSALRSVESTRKEVTNGTGTGAHTQSDNLMDQIMADAMKKPWERVSSIEPRSKPLSVLNKDILEKNSVRNREETLKRRLAEGKGRDFS